MVTHRLLAIAGVIVLTASAPVAADNDTPKLLPEEGRKNPYAKLFSDPSIAAPQRPTRQALQAPRVEKPKVVCGMVMIPVDAGIDPHMRKSSPEGDNTKYTIRAVKPPMCTSP